MIEYTIIKKENGTVGLKEINRFEQNGDCTSIESMLFTFNELLGISELENEQTYLLSCRDGILTSIYHMGIGNYHECSIDTRSAAIFVLLSGAHGFLQVHNHPTGELVPSGNDILVHEFFEWMSRNIEVKYYGSYIIGESGWYDVATNEEHKWLV